MTGAFVWTWGALPGVVSCLISWALAVLVYKTRPDRTQNRLLALFLATTGAAWLLNQGLATSFASQASAEHAMLAFLWVHHLAHVFHFWFIGTLDSRIAQVLRRPSARALILVLAAASWVSLALEPHAWIMGTVPAPSEGAWLIVFGPRMSIAGLFYVITFLLGVLVAIDAFRRAEGGATRRQARAYLLAFLGHDGGLMLWNLWFATMGATATLLVIERMVHWVPPLANLWMVSWLTYGILTTQLFDIDLRIRLALERSTLATSFLAGLWVLTELLESLLPFDSLLLGLIAAGGLSLLFRPATRLAHRFADVVMPGTIDAERHRLVRGQEVYEATLAGALVDGEVTARERDMLHALRVQLGLEEAQAAMIEERVRQGAVADEAR